MEELPAQTAKPKSAEQGAEDAAPALPPTHYVSGGNPGDCGRKDAVPGVPNTKPGFTTERPVKPMMGLKWVVDKKDNDDVTRIITQRSWPTQARKHVRGSDGTGKGSGTCLGATYEQGVARLGHHTRDFSDVIIRLIILLNKYVSNFTWTSIQVNVDTVSEKHRDANNDGPSVMFILGDFT